MHATALFSAVLHFLREDIYNEQAESQLVREEIASLSLMTPFKKRTKVGKTTKGNTKRNVFP